MLILATVSILALTGDQGLFAKAREARTSTQNKSEEEQIKLEVMASWDEQGNLLAGTVRRNLVHIQEANVEPGTGFPITVVFTKTKNKTYCSNYCIPEYSLYNLYFNNFFQRCTASWCSFIKN